MAKDEQVIISFEELKISDGRSCTNVRTWRCEQAISLLGR